MNEFNDDQRPASESLKHLAEAYGVSTEYWDYHGNLASPSSATLKAVLTALGVSARTDEEIERSLQDVEDAPWRQTLAPTVVTRGGVESTVPVYVPDGAKVRVRVELEDGGVRELTQTEDWTVPREVDGVKRGRASFILGADLPLGWHTLVADIDACPAREAFSARAPLAVTPDRLELPAAQQPDAGTMIGWTSSTTAAIIRRIGDAHLQIPDGFTPHPKVARLFERRAKMTHDGGVDWGMGELLAFGSLLIEGVPVRMSGQDVRRGTFVQRHAVAHDRETGEEWTPLDSLTADQARLWIYDSPLSEYGVLAFEYGYSVERPDALVVWEAQFGDFANGAQTVVDEFVSSATQKWGQRSSLVMLLPHGYEGQGPDHSSGRMERYLQLCAQGNMWVCQPSTPANHFHLLRTQAYGRPRRPLIVFSPKQLLRRKGVTSAIEDFTAGAFRPVVGDAALEAGGDPARPDRVLLCSGRIAYDLLDERARRGDRRTAILRLEQIYPLACEELGRELARYPGAEVVWVQDEPENMGAWRFLAATLFPELGIAPRLVARPESASPSAGLTKAHAAENARLMERAFQR